MMDLTPQAISDIADPDQVRILLFVNNQSVHVPALRVVEGIGDLRYLQLTGGTLTGALNGTTATFSGAVSGAVGTFTGLLTTNGQVAFPATQNPSVGANTLDDYEEGTFTPGINFGGGTTGITYATQLGAYIKVGRLVTVGIRVTLSNKGSSTGAANITGLPFTVSNSPANTLHAANFAYWAAGASTLNPAGYCLQNTTTMGIVNRGGGAVTGCSNTDFTNTTDIVVSATYLASA